VARRYGILHQLWKMTLESAMREGTAALVFGCFRGTRDTLLTESPNCVR
jgi:hypothetical protein